MKTKGFTLIELMIVVAVAGILVAIVAGAVSDSNDTAEVTMVEDNLMIRIEAGLNKGHYGNQSYWDEVAVNASHEYAPVCVHGHPYFMTRRGPQAGTLVRAMDERGHKPSQRFWAACKAMGSDLHEIEEAKK